MGYQRKAYRTPKDKPVVTYKKSVMEKICLADTDRNRLKEPLVFWTTSRYLGLKSSQNPLPKLRCSTWQVLKMGPFTKVYRGLRLV